MERDAIIAAIILAVGFGGGWAINGWRLSGEVERLRGDNARFHDANEEFVEAVRECKAAVTDFRKAAEEREAAGAKAKAEADRKAGVLLAQVGDLLKRPLPKDPAQDCAALGADLDEAIRERKAK